MLDLNEKEIMKTWDLDKYAEPLVTIQCATFNHENYIETALDSFLKQKTTFPFVIFVHDDCSTDTTADIIKKYKKKYPKIINSVIEKENLWSKKDDSFTEVIKANIHTKYVALCEGDDFWIDDNKLNKQVRFLENNPDFSISITNGKTYDVITKKYEEIFLGDEKKFASSKHVIDLSNCSVPMFPPTASYVYRYDHRNEIDKVPKCFNGDMRKRLFYMTRGKCYYFKDEMVVYRINVNGSAMTRAKKKCRKAKFNQELQTCRMIDYIDKLSQYKYTDELWKIKVNRLNSALSNAHSLKVIFDPYFKRVWRESSYFRKVILIIKIVMPEFLYMRICK